MSARAKPKGKQRAKKQAEIIPPNKDDDATARAGAHLRMPPLIDDEGGWRALAARFVATPLSGFFAAVYAGGRNMLGALLYRLTLLALVGTALAVTGYGIWQARHMDVPQFDGFWFSEKTAIDNRDHADASTPASAAPSGDMAVSNTPLQGLTSSAPVPVDSDAGPAIAAQAIGDKETDSIPGAAPNDAAMTRLQAQYDELQEKYAALLMARNAAQQAKDVLEAQGAAQNDLLARAALGDLLLRLDNGAAYDDLLEAGDLERVLRRSEWTLLALYADSGIPTRPALLMRFELWVANARAPDAMRTRAVDNGFYRAMLDWLRTRAAGLVTVRVAPLATAEGDIAMIAKALERGRHDEAAWRMSALLRRMESDRSVNHPDMASLQLLYDDTRAAAELSPMLAALRDDYMSGARP
jgi:hypothetical protein